MRLLLLCLLLSSCAKLSHYKTYQKGEDFYKYQFKQNQTDNAVRNKDGKLVFSKEKSNQTLHGFETVDDLEKSIAVECEVNFDLKKSYHKAISQLQSGDAISSRKILDDISRKCKNIKKYSHINYLYAYGYQLGNLNQQRDLSLKEFLEYSERVFPKSFYQTNTNEESLELYKKYKQHAKEVLNGKKFVFEQDKSKHLGIARYDSLDDSYMVGSKVKSEHFLVLPYYSTITRGGIQGAYVFPTKHGAFIPAVSINGQFGTLGGFNFRRQLTETLDRKHQTGINIGLYQWKEFSYTKDYLGQISNVKVEDEGVGTRIGYGGTYQFTSKYNFMYQGVGYSAREFGTNLTSLLGYRIDQISMFQYGLLHNDTVLAWKVMQIYILYNFSAKSVEANISTGFTF